MTSKHAARGVLGLTFAGVALAGGCSRDAAPQPLTADQFVSRRVEGRTDPEPIDRPGQVIVDGVKPPTKDDTGVAPPPPRVQRASDISPTVRESVRVPGDAAAATVRRENASANLRPANQADPAAPEVPTDLTPGTDAAAAGVPTTGPDPSGQYVIFGTVLAQVNSRPIYAHKVLAVLDNALRAEAQRYNQREFRTVAAKLITDEVRTQVREELVFAVADKSLDAREKMVAENLTAQWKNDEITKAGGSEELARRKWVDEGWDFDERVDFQYRASMKQVFLQRRLFPLVHVTASDIRRYYEANKGTEFTSPARAKFRVIKIDPKQLRLEGGLTAAQRLASEIRVKGQAGNFEALARDVNDPLLKETGGLVGGNSEGWLPKGSYVVEKVENAVWALQPGQVTPVIEEKGAFYVAKLEDKQEAAAQEFEDLAVQQTIDGKLRAQQFRQLEEQRQNMLMKDAVIQENPQGMQIALDMAMQRYPQWAAATGNK